jgi:glutaredoxin-like protein NrdH
MSTKAELITAHRGSPIVYSKPGCPPCWATKRKFDKLGLEYREVDTSKDEAARDMLKDAGFMESPVIITSTGAWSGFDPDQITALTFDWPNEEDAAA